VSRPCHHRFDDVAVEQAGVAHRVALDLAVDRLVRMIDEKVSTLSASGA
jgi:hypothetical protein